MSDLSETSSSSSSFSDSEDEIKNIPMANSSKPVFSNFTNDTNMATLNHPLQNKIFETLEFIQTIDSSIDFAYYLHGLNEHLMKVIQKKENKLKKRTFNETYGIDASVANFMKFRAIQDQYQSFYGSTSTLNNIQGNATTNNFLSFHNVSNLPRNNKGSNLSRMPQTFPENVSSVLQNGNKVPTQRINSTAPKFSEMEDTFASGISNSSHLNKFYRPNVSSFINTRAGGRGISNPINPTPLHCSFMGNLRNNQTLTQANNATVTEPTNFANDSENNYRYTGDKFNCVRVGPLSEKFRLPDIEEDFENGSNSSEDSPREKPSEKKTKEIKQTTSVNGISTIKQKSQKNVTTNALEKNCVLKNWTVLLKDGNMFLSGNKMMENEIVEHNHVSKVIKFRTRDGKIKTDDFLYELKPPFILNKDMPEKVRHYFRNQKFPLTWRRMVQVWLQEKSRVTKESATKEKIVGETKSKKTTEDNSREKKVKKVPKTTNTNPKTKKGESLDKEKTLDESQNKRNEDKCLSEVINKNSTKKIKKKTVEGLVLEKSEKTDSSKVKNDNDMLGDSLIQDRVNTCTPTALLRSIRKNTGLPLSRASPPLVYHYLNGNGKKTSKNDTDSSLDLQCKDNEVTKRVAKVKGTKKVKKKQAVEKCILEDDENDEIQNVMNALTNKTPQTTPKVIREVFRSEEDPTFDSDFGSDVSSICN